MRNSRFLPKRLRKSLYARHIRTNEIDTISDILDEEKADAIVQEIIARENKKKEKNVRFTKEPI
jgi:hypothetical protein